MISRQIERTAVMGCPVTRTAESGAMGGRWAAGALAHEETPAVIDVLAVCTSPALSVYLAGVVQPFRWALDEVRTVAEALEVLDKHRTAVVVCESTLGDGTWRDLAGDLRGLRSAPALIVVEDDSLASGEVEAAGGFGTISMQHREADVIWTLASAWHMWTSEAEVRRSIGGAACSGG